MHRRLRVPLAFLILLLAAGPISAQGEDIKPRHSDPFWHASYWNNVTLAGDPVLQETHAALDWDWGSGSPHPAVGADGFSLRCTRYLDFTAGSYRFYATSDDGIRVYVDNRLIIDQWHDHSIRTYTADLDLAAGHHLAVVEYYENMGDAVAKVSWAPVPIGPRHWRGEYFANRWLSGAPVMIRDSDKIDFHWGYGSPVGSVPADGFSIRWTGTVDFGAGASYRFTTSTDDGVRLWVNGHLLIDRWVDQSFRSYSGTIYAAGDVPVKMEYYEAGGVAAARLTWVPSDGEPPADAIIVDDTDAGCSKNGLATAWRAASGGHGGTLTWTRNNDRPRYNYNWARWYPDLAASRYEVFVHVPTAYASTTQARYWVSHSGGYTLRVVNQSANRGGWVSLGTYHFRGTRADHVSLSDVTYERYLSKMIAFDAVKWEPR